MKKTPSERIALIQRIATKLGAEDWTIVDLTLRQFGLPTYDTWEGGDKKEYVMAMIERGADEILAQLDYHLTGEKSEINSQDTLDFWQPGQYRMFLSHISKYRKQASTLKEKLNQYHISVFVAHQDIAPTSEWQADIELAIATTDCLLALVTDDFRDSPWTDQEIGIAIGKGKLIIPVACGSKPYGFISKYQWLKHDIQDIANVGEDIFTILSKHNLSKRKFSEALVNKFESSYSFASARANIELLEKVDYLDPDLLKKIQKAHDQNPQIIQSYGVTSRVQRLIKKIEAA